MILEGHFLNNRIIKQKKQAIPLNNKSTFPNFSCQPLCNACCHGVALKEPIAFCRNDSYLQNLSKQCNSIAKQMRSKISHLIHNLLKHKMKLRTVILKKT